jgi:branched-chain amino acid aminotransferase
MKIYIDGAYYDKEDAKISVYDHGLLYGDGIFEGIRIYSGKIFKLEEHIKRLYRSAAALRLVIPMKQDEMERTVEEAVGLNEKKDGYIRLVVTRGKGNLGIDPTSCPSATVIIMVEDIQLYPEELYEKGIRIITASIRRLSGDILDPRIKTLNYLNNIMAKMEAQDAGCPEAVLLNKEGYVSECTADNIFIFREGELLTPAPWLGILEGITRGTILELAQKQGIPYRETTLTCFDLYTADECFLTGSGAELIPVTKIDGRPIGSGLPGEISKKIKEAFTALIHS